MSSQGYVFGDNNIDVFVWSFNFASLNQTDSGGRYVLLYILKLDLCVPYHDPRCTL